MATEIKARTPGELASIIYKAHGWPHVRTENKMKRCKTLYFIRFSPDGEWLIATPRKPQSVP